jgi:hypothetical protein
MEPIKLLLLTSTMIFLCSTTGYACTCIQIEKSLAVDLEKYGAVFSGKVVDIKKSETREHTVEVKLMVEKSWKYVDTEEAIVLTDEDESACGFPFKVGESYLIWAWKSKDGNKLGTNYCSRTQGLMGADKTLKELGEATIKIRQGQNAPGNGQPNNSFNRTRNIAALSCSS